MTIYGITLLHGVACPISYIRVGCVAQLNMDEYPLESNYGGSIVSHSRVVGFRGTT